MSGLRSFKLAFLAGGMAAVVFLGGCQVFDALYSGTVRLVDPDRATIRGGVAWKDPAPPLRSVGIDRRVAHLRLRNSAGSGVPLSALRRRIAEYLDKSGYLIVENPNRAQYILNIDIRGLGEDASKKEGGFSEILAVATGAAVGAVVSKGDSKAGLETARAVGGAVAGGVVGVLRNRNKDRRVELLLDVTISERIEGGVDTRRLSQRGRGRVGDERRSDDGFQDRQRVEFSDDFLHYRNRMVAYAERLNLKTDKAIEFLLDRTAAALAGTLP